MTKQHRTNRIPDSLYEAITDLTIERMFARHAPAMPLADKRLAALADEYEMQLVTATVDTVLDLLNSNLLDLLAAAPAEEEEQEDEE